MDIRQYVYDLRTILKYIQYEKIMEIADVLQETNGNGKRIYVMGNGGSATTASHIAGDLNKTCGLKAMALTDSNYLITAWANDTYYGSIFVAQLDNLLRPEDVVIGISGSGQSSNVNNAIRHAKSIGATTIAFTGTAGDSGGGKLKEIADISIIVSSFVMEQIEDIHLMIGHILVIELKNRK